jgi:SAM-dependent methyltransferase
MKSEINFLNQSLICPDCRLPLKIRFNKNVISCECGSEFYADNQNKKIFIDFLRNTRNNQIYNKKLPNLNFGNEKMKEVAKYINPNKSVLDIGSEFFQLQNFLKNNLYIGIEVSYAKLQFAKAGQNVIHFDMNRNILPFKDNSFDYIVCLDVLEHLLDPIRTLEEIHRIVKSNGRVIVSLPNDYHILNRIRFILNKPIYLDPFYPYGHLHLFTRNQAKKLLSENFRIQKTIIFPGHRPKCLKFKMRKIIADYLPNILSNISVYVLNPKNKIQIK